MQHLSDQIPVFLQIKSVVVGFHELLVTVPASPGDLMAQVGIKDSDPVCSLFFNRLVCTSLCLPVLLGCWSLHMVPPLLHLPPHFQDPRLPWPEDNQSQTEYILNKLSILGKLPYFWSSCGLMPCLSRTKISLKKLYLYLMQILQIRYLGHTNIISKLYRKKWWKGTWRENGVLGNASRRVEHLHLSIFIWSKI